MDEAEYEPFFNGPVGRYTVVRSIVVWCDSPALCGAVLWGAPSPEDTRRVLAIFDQYDRHMDATFDIVLDTRGVEHVARDSLELLFSWLQQRRVALTSRIRLQASVIREGPIGFLLTGLLPVVGRTHPYRIFTDDAAAFAAVGARGDLKDELERLTARLRGTPEELHRLRALLDRDPSTSLGRAARALGTSQRSLQRTLLLHHTSFSREVSRARLGRALTLLRSTDEKLAVISERVGISERSLIQLVQGHTGLTPAAWRARERESPSPDPIASVREEDPRGNS